MASECFLSIETAKDTFTALLKQYIVAMNNWKAAQATLESLAVI